MKYSSRAILYLLAHGLQHLGGLLLLPFLVAALTSEEFTRFGLMTSAFQLLAIILSLNLHRAPARLYFDHGDAQGRSNLLMSTLVTSCGLTALGLVGLVAWLHFGGFRDPISQGSLRLQVLLGVTVLLTVAVDFGKLLMKTRGEARVFTLTAILQGFGILLLFLLFDRLSFPGLMSIALAYCAGMGLVACLALGYAWRHFAAGHFRVGLVRDALAYSWPVVIHMLALWAVGTGGRWIGAFHMPLEALASYTLMTVLVSVVGMLTRSLFEARLPEIGSAFAGGRFEAGARVIQVTTFQALVAVAAVYAAGFTALVGLGFELPAGYQPSPRLLVFAAVANFFESFFVGGIKTLHALKKTHVQAFSTAVSGLLSVALGLLLVRTHAAEGLMAALAAGMALQAIASNLLGRYHIGQANAQRSTKGEDRGQK